MCIALTPVSRLKHSKCTSLQYPVYVERHLVANQHLQHIISPLPYMLHHRHFRPLRLIARYSYCEWIRQCTCHTLWTIFCHVKNEQHCSVRQTLWTSDCRSKVTHTLERVGCYRQATSIGISSCGRTSCNVVNSTLQYCLQLWLPLHIITS